MTLKKLTAAYSIISGLAIFASWTAYLLTGKIMGVTLEGPGTSFHVAAEYATGAVLLVASVGLLKNLPWGRSAFLLGMGMMIYALIGGPGFYVGKGPFIMIVFAVSLAFALLFSTIALTMKD